MRKAAVETAVPRPSALSAARSLAKGKIQKKLTFFLRNVLLYNYNKQNVIFCVATRSLSCIKLEGTISFTVRGTGVDAWTAVASPSRMKPEIGSITPCCFPLRGTGTIYIPLRLAGFHAPVISREQAETLFVRDIPISGRSFHDRAVCRASTIQRVRRAMTAGIWCSSSDGLRKEQAQRPPAESGRSALPQARGGAAARRASNRWRWGFRFTRFRRYIEV